MRPNRGGRGWVRHMHLVPNSQKDQSRNFQSKKVQLETGQSERKSEARRRRREAEGQDHFMAAAPGGDRGQLYGSGEPARHLRHHHGWRFIRKPHEVTSTSRSVDRVRAARRRACIRKSRVGVTITSHATEEEASASPRRRSFAERTKSPGRPRPPRGTLRRRRRPEAKRRRSEKPTAGSRRKTSKFETPAGYCEGFAFSPGGVFRAA